MKTFARRLLRYLACLLFFAFGESKQVYDATLDLFN